MSDPFRTNFEGEPPDGVFLQINLRADGSVGYKFTEDLARWPKDGIALQRIVGTTGLIWWQLNDWATRLMRISERSQAQMLDLLTRLPEGEKVN